MNGGGAFLVGESSCDTGLEVSGLEVSGLEVSGLELFPTRGFDACVYKSVVRIHHNSKLVTAEPILTGIRMGSDGRWSCGTLGTAHGWAFVEDGWAVLHRMSLRSHRCRSWGVLGNSHGLGLEYDSADVHGPEEGSHSTIPSH